MTKYTKNMIGLFIAGFLITVIGGYVIGKLDLYKREIERLHGYHSAVINRQQEDIEYRTKPEEPQSRRMTYRELAEWLSKGNGQYKVHESSSYYNSLACCSSEDCKEVPVDYKLRRWGSDEWIEPTVDVYEQDCKKECE